MKYTPLRSILNYIPKTIRNETDEPTLLDYALSAYRQLNISQSYEYKFEILEVVNHKVKLPDDLVLINNIHIVDNMDNDDYDELQLCKIDVKDIIDKPDYLQVDYIKPICETVSYRLVSESKWFKEKWKPVKYVGNSPGYFCKNCPALTCNSCEYRFFLDPACNNITIYELENGFICLDYCALLANYNNDFLIPDDETLKVALSTYAIAMNLRDRAYSKEEGAYQMYNNELQKANIALTKAKSTFVAKGVNIDNTWAMLSNSFRITQISGVWNKLRILI